MEEKAKPKKQWHKPALIVLVRRKSGEAVLDVCKNISEADPEYVECLGLSCSAAAPS